MPTPLPEQLSNLATAVADGAPIDWPSLESAASSEDERRYVSRLKTIADVAHLHATGVLVDSQLNSCELPNPAEYGEDVPVCEVGSSWGDLRILEIVGSGRYGVVYRAWDPKLEREVALKLLRQRELPDSTEVMREARLMARVHHRNVVSVFGVDCRDGQVGFWMQFVRGRTLAAELAANGPFTADDVVAIARDLCDALTAVHRAGLVHRDVKPQNIMRDDDGGVLLGDFGAGSVIEQRGAGVAGTPLFLAPELLTGRVASERTDVYALGVTLFHLATGAFPVFGRSIGELRDAWQRGAQPTPIASVRPDLHADIAAAIDGALSPSPDQRWPTSAALRAALDRSTHAVGTGPSPAVRRSVIRRTMAAAAVVTVLAAATFISQQRRPLPAGAESRPQQRLLIGAFDNTTPRPELDDTVVYALERELTQVHNVRITPRAAVDDTLRLMKRRPDTDLDMNIAREVGVRDGRTPMFVVGRIEAAATGVIIQASLVNVADGAAAGHFSVRTGELNELPSAIAQLAAQITGALGAALSPTDTVETLEPVTTPSLEALRLYSEAYRLGARAEWTAALELSRLAVAADPDFPAARIWLAWCLLRANAPAAEYQPVAAEALRLASHASAWERLWIEGSYHSLIGNDERAISFYEGVLELQPDHDWAAGNIAIAYGRLGRYGDAVPVALRLAEIRPHDHRTLNIAFSALRRGGRIEEAAKIAERMRTLHLNEQRYWLADVWAFDAYVAWLAADARTTRLELDRITTQVLALNDAAKVTILPELAHMYIALGRPTDARRVIQSIPDVPQRNLHLAILQLTTGDPAGARPFALQTRAGANDSRNLWDRLWVLARSGAVAEARALADLARRPPPSNSAMVEATRARGDWLKAAEADIAVAGKNPAAAIALLTDALPALMSDVTVTPSQMYRAADSLAEALAAEGRNVEAARQLKAVLERQERATFAGAALWALRCAVRLEQLSDETGDAVLARELREMRSRRSAEAEPSGTRIP